MIRIKKYGRKWYIYGDESLLSPWAEDVENIKGELIQQHGSCCIWRVTAENEKSYFVKRERCFHLPFTTSRAEKEYLAFALLGDKGIPCMECSAWSATFDDSVIVTQELPSKFSTLRKYWYSSPEINVEFLKKLCDFLADTAQAGVTIPDMSAENLITDGDSIVIVNPAGAAEAEATNSPAPEFLKTLEIAFGEYPMEQLAELVHKSGMYSSPDEARSILTKMQSEWQEENEKEWNRIKPQLLSGTTKFATLVDGEIFYRNSAWFTPILRHPENILEEKELPESEAKEIWLDSFYCQLQKKPCSEIPVIYRKTEGNVKISVLKEKKYSFFYGFY